MDALRTRTLNESEGLASVVRRELQKRGREMLANCTQLMSPLYCVKAYGHTISYSEDHGGVCLKFSLRKS